MKKSFQFEVGMAEHVIEHARYRASRGKRPSLSFLAERNPRKALAVAVRFVEDKKARQVLDRAITRFGTLIIEASKGSEYTNRTTDEVKVVARAIIMTSRSEAEVKHRLVEELGCPCEPSTNMLTAIDRAGVEAKELCLALGGVTLRTGELIQVMFEGPNMELIFI